jgi:hypothetical protein
MVDRSKFHATSILHTYRDIFSSELQILQQYAVEANSSFESKAIELQQYRNEVQEEMLNAWEDEYFKNALYFPKILNGSILITFQTLLEKTLATLVRKCEHIFQPQGMITKRKRESDTGFYIRQLQEMFNVAIDNAKFTRLEEFRQIRNLFAHHSGSLNFYEPARKERVIHIVRNSDDKLLYNKHTAEVIIDKSQYLIDFSLLIESLILPVFGELLQRHHLILSNSGSA